MSDVITLYYNPMSRAAIAHWMLEEAEVPYEMRLLSFDKGENRSPDFLKLNPMGKLPTIEHRGVVVSEAAAICAYIADAFPEKGLAPSLGDPARGLYFRWLFFAAGCLEPAAIDKAFNREVPGKRGTLGYGSYDDTMNALEAMLETAMAKGPYLLGDQFTAADVYVGSQLDWGLQFKTFPERPIFKRYVHTLTERSGYKRFTASRDQYIETMQQS